MTLTIITITLNNLAGLRRTLQSVYQQEFADYDIVVVDGASTDGTADWLAAQQEEHRNLRFISEHDGGVYEAQNKGIKMAQGEYLYFLNAGDLLANKFVLQRVFADSPKADIIYGNEILVDANNRRVGYCKGVANPTFLDIYTSCMKHQATFIRRSLFDNHGVYDTTLRIVADWEWFMRVIAVDGKVSLLYRDIDISLFDTTGMSHHNGALCKAERQQVLDRYMSRSMQADYLWLEKVQKLRRNNGKPTIDCLLRVLNKLAGN